MQDVARFCNAYPNVDVSHSILEADSITTGENVNVSVQLERESDSDVIVAHAPFYPKERLEGWWMVIGDTKNNQLACIKRLTITKSTDVKLEFKAPEEPGEYTYSLYLMCDSYAGCDQEFELKFNVLKGESNAIADKMDED